MFASSGDATVQLEESIYALAGRYGELPVSTPGAEVNIALLRDESRSSAPGSACTMPPVPIISAPDSGTSFSRSSDSLDIAWELDGADPITVELSGSCVDAYDQTVSGDEGRVSVPAGALGGDGGGECDVTVTVIRSAEGALDGALAGGTISCQQLRRVDIIATP